MLVAVEILNDQTLSPRRARIVTVRLAPVEKESLNGRSYLDVGLREIVARENLEIQAGKQVVNHLGHPNVVVDSVTGEFAGYAYPRSQGGFLKTAVSKVVDYFWGDDPRAAGLGDLVGPGDLCSRAEFLSTEVGAIWAEAAAPVAEGGSPLFPMKPSWRTDSNCTGENYTGTCRVIELDGWDWVPPDQKPGFPRAEMVAAETARCSCGFRGAEGSAVKRFTNWNGLTLAIEHEIGDTRHPAGSPLTVAYGYFVNLPGFDGENLDCYIGPDLSSQSVYVVEQNTLEGFFDEIKVMLGFRSVDEARAAYLENMPPLRFGGIKEIPSANLFRGAARNEPDRFESARRLTEAMRKTTDPNVFALVAGARMLLR